MQFEKNDSLSFSARPQPPDPPPRACDDSPNQPQRQQQQQQILYVETPPTSPADGFAFKYGHATDNRTPVDHFAFKYGRAPQHPDRRVMPRVPAAVVFPHQPPPTRASASPPRQNWGSTRAYDYQTNPGYGYRPPSDHGYRPPSSHGYRSHTRPARQFTHQQQQFTNQFSSEQNSWTNPGAGGHRMAGGRRGGRGRESRAVMQAQRDFLEDAYIARSNSAGF